MSGPPPQICDSLRAAEGLQALLSSGEVAAEQLPGLTAPRDAILWSERDSLSIATPRLVELMDHLPSLDEAVAALFSTEPDLRTAWLRILLARLREIGGRRDLAALCDAITTAGSLARELVEGLAPSLAPTAFGELERRILPAAAHEGPAFPVLLRALSATAALLSQAPAAATAVPEVAWDDPSRTWTPGRLIRLPSREDSIATRSVLTGGVHDRAGRPDAMRWVLERPWAFLLAQMVFTQEAWGAERVSGGLAFELEAAHLPLFQCPPRVAVVVTLPAGQEVQCGPLGEFVLRTLGQLGVVVLGHRVTADVLDDRLGVVIEALLCHEVWTFEHRTGGRRSGYTIHPTFSDACYRALGSRAFYRLGSAVTAAIRRVSQTWAGDRVARAGASGGRER